MVNFLDYAALSATIYNNERGSGNILGNFPTGWNSIGYIPGGGLNGFTAGAYRNGNDIIIAFKGHPIFQMAQLWVFCYHLF